MWLQFISIVTLTIFVGLIIEYIFAYFRPHSLCDHRQKDITAWSHHGTQDEQTPSSTAPIDDLLD